MNKVDTFKKLESSKIFSFKDVVFLDPQTSIGTLKNSLSHWVKSGSLLLLKKGLYILPEKKNIVSKEYVAHRLLSPSYVSLSYALFIFGIIPDVVYQVTSITTKTTRIFTNLLGAFTYNNVDTSLFFGFTLHEGYYLAEPEKAFLDYLYFLHVGSGKRVTKKQLELCRFQNLETLSKVKLEKYAKKFDSAKINLCLHNLKLL